MKLMKCYVPKKREKRGGAGRQARAARKNRAAALQESLKKGYPRPIEPAGGDQGAVPGMFRVQRPVDRVLHGVGVPSLRVSAVSKTVQPDLSGVCLVNRDFKPKFQCRICGRMGHCSQLMDLEEIKAEALAFKRDHVCRREHGR